MASGSDSLSGQHQFIRRAAGDLSYKFQRLRERLRQAVTSGELSGKLPGERTLAKKYNCNAKTLSKALTDLAAEGLLDRAIGRGTYVMGSAPKATAAGNWLILSDNGVMEKLLVPQLSQKNSCQVVVGDSFLRPSFVNQFTAIIDLTSQTPAPFLRDLVIRGVSFVMIGSEPRTLSVDAVLIDVAKGISRLSRELLLRGHTSIGVVEAPGSTTLTEMMRQYTKSQATVDAFAINDLVAAVEGGISVLVCDSASTASRVIGNLSAVDISVPHRVSVVAVGPMGAKPPCTGCFVSGSEVVEAAVAMLADRQTRRPATVWLAPAFYAGATLATVASASGASATATSGTGAGGAILRAGLGNMLSP